MTRHTKILFLVIGVFIIIVGILFATQFSTFLRITTRVKTTPLVSAEYYPIAVTVDDPTIGNPGAAIEIIEFVDLGDNRSKEIHTTISTFVRAHPQEVRLVWKDFPMQSILLGNNNAAHVAAWCAFKQTPNKFWGYTDKLLEKNSNLKPQGLENVATELKLDTIIWQRCVASPEANDHLKTNITVGQGAGLSRAPGLFINSKRINIDEVDLSQMLESLLTTP